MAIPIDFPTDPYVVLQPHVRWFPGEEVTEDVYERLLPPLVHKVRDGVKKWRDGGYRKVSPTTRALLTHWFGGPHLRETPDGSQYLFRYFFAQREAVESVIWLFEAEGARDPYSLIRYDSSGRLAKGMFPETWPRYVAKMATGSGKTKLLSLLMAWSYFHSRYEKDSPLSRNLLLIAPNIIVLERLRLDFDGLRIFHQDPVLPPNGYEGRDWVNDFQLQVHIQDNIGTVSTSGNLFLTNIHRVYEGPADSSADDDDRTEFFLGKRPTGPTTAGQVDLTDVIRDIDDLVVLNDEAHHIHDPGSEWFKSIQRMNARLIQKGGQLAAQFDVTATPKDARGGIFPQTVSDYPLVEAIRQNVVKTPVLPDEASRAKLKEEPSDDPTVRYRDYLHLGYLEWEKRFKFLEPTGKKSVLFVMTADTSECDEIAEYLESTYPELEGAVLTIHTKKDGTISEAAGNKSELDVLREASRKIDRGDNPYRAVVSVLMLREGWDVENVVSMVGLRPYTAEARILPEQTLGRGLRRMFRGDADVTEYLSVVGTDAFIDFVEGIRTEGVELQYVEMGKQTTPTGPLVVEVDHSDKSKDIDALDIELPILTPRIQRQYKNLDLIDVAALPAGGIEPVEFSEAEQREIVFRDLDTGEITWTTDVGRDVTPSASAVVAYFTNGIIRALHLVGGHDLLYGRIKEYIETRLFTRTVSVGDANTLRNLSEPAAARKIHETFVQAINSLTVSDVGITEVRHRIKLSKVRPFVTNNRPNVKLRKTVFSRVVGDSRFELAFAAWLDQCTDIVSFAKNDAHIRFHIEYVKADGDIGNYRPDFIVKEDASRVWIVETKGREDVNVLPKWERLEQWCADATAADSGHIYQALYVEQDAFEGVTWLSWRKLVDALKDARPTGTPDAPWGT